MQETVQEDRVSTTQDDWQDAVEFTRYNTDDNRIASGTIEDAEIQEDEVHLTVTPVGLERKVECTLDATVRPNQRSKFEKFLDQQGYDPTDDNLFEQLKGDQCDLRVKSRNKALEFNVYVEQSDNSNENSDSREVTKENIHSMAIGFMVGIIPALNLFIILAEVFDGVTIPVDDDRIERSDYYSLLGFTVSITILYALIPIYLLVSGVAI